MFFCLRSFNVVGGERRKLRGSLQEVLTSAARPRTPCTSPSVTAANSSCSARSCLPTFLMPPTPKSPCLMTNSRCVLLLSFRQLSPKPRPGVTTAIPERTCSVPRHCPDKVQLRLGFGEKPSSRAPGRGCPAASGHVPPTAFNHCR